MNTSISSNTLGHAGSYRFINGLSKQILIGLAVGAPFVCATMAIVSNRRVSERDAAVVRAANDSKEAATALSNHGWTFTPSDAISKRPYVDAEFRGDSDIVH